MAHHDPIGLIAPHAGLAQLNERSRDIFRQIVESYLATGEPVGSRNISRLIAVPLSPASVRNVMSDLEQLGLIYAPHTSAGRLPTELGLRFFVDALMQVGDLTEAERQSIQSQLASVGRAQSVEAALGEALTRLSGLTRAAAVVLTAKSNSRLKHIEFVRLEPERALVVLVGEDGQVENRVLTLAAGRAVVGADGGDQFSQCADPRAHACGSAARTRNRAGAEPRRARPVDAEGDRAPGSRAGPAATTTTGS